MSSTTCLVLNCRPCKTIKSINKLFLSCPVSLRGGCIMSFKSITWYFLFLSFVRVQQINSSIQTKLFNNYSIVVQGQHMKESAITLFTVLPMKHWTTVITIILQKKVWCGLNPRVSIACHVRLFWRGLFCKELSLIKKAIATQSYLILTDLNITNAEFPWEQDHFWPNII